MRGLLFDPNVNLATELSTWAIGALLYGFALWVATRITRVRITALALVLITVVSSVVALVPHIGTLLSFLAAVFLLYRLTDAEHTQHAWLSVLIAQCVVVLFALAVHSNTTKQEEAEMKRQQGAVYQELLQKANAEVTNDIANPTSHVNE